MHLHIYNSKCCLVLLSEGEILWIVLALMLLVSFNMSIYSLPELLSYLLLVQVVPGIHLFGGSMLILVLVIDFVFSQCVAYPAPLPSPNLKFYGFLLGALPQVGVGDGAWPVDSQDCLWFVEYVGGTCPCFESLQIRMDLKFESKMFSWVLRAIFFCFPNVI